MRLMSRKADLTTKRFVVTQEVIHVTAIPPDLWLRRIRAMPHMKDARGSKNGSDSDAGGTQSIRQVIVLATPADEALIKPINALEVVPPYCDI